MKEEILTAKEWLAKNLMSETFTTGDYWIDRMEKYANYKNRILEDRIKEFEQKLRFNIGVGGIWNSEWSSLGKLMIEEYDKHFNIK